MPNRILKESICTSDSIAALSWFEEVLFYRLIVSCDDYGRYDGRPAIIKNRLFPLSGDDVTLEAVTTAVNNLATTGMIALYETDGKCYISIPSWNKHQSLRAKRSKYPEPDKQLQAIANTCKQMQADASNCIQVHADADNCTQSQAIASICPRNPIQSNTIQSSRSLPRAGARARAREDDDTTDTTQTDMKCEKCGARITEGVASYSRDKFGKLLCQKCQPRAAPAKNSPGYFGGGKPDAAAVRASYEELEAEERDAEEGEAWSPPF